MNNLLTNAGFVDQADGWAAAPGVAVLTVDEAERGAPGRVVLRATANATGFGEACRIAPAANTRPSVGGLASIEVQIACAAFVDGAATAPVARLVFLDGGGSPVTVYDLPLRAPQLARWGVGRLGLLDTYHRSAGRFPTPPGAATATVEVAGMATTSGQAVEVLLLKPFIGVPSPAGSLLLWSPGSHRLADLMLTAWPGALREFDAGAGGEAKPWAAEFDAGSGPPMARRTAKDPARKFSGKLRCDVVQRGILEAFAAANAKFWMVEPDSERLCVARFAADGAPRLSETRGGWHHMEVVLWLETA